MQILLQDGREGKTLALLSSSGALLDTAARCAVTGTDETPTGTLADSDFSHLRGKTGYCALPKARHMARS